MIVCVYRAGNVYTHGTLLTHMQTGPLCVCWWSMYVCVAVVGTADARPSTHTAVCLSLLAKPPPPTTHTHTHTDFAHSYLNKCLFVCVRVCPMRHTAVTEWLVAPLSLSGECGCLYLVCVCECLLLHAHYGQGDVTGPAR